MGCPGSRESAVYYNAKLELGVLVRRRLWMLQKCRRTLGIRAAPRKSNDMLPDRRRINAAHRIHRMQFEPSTLSFEMALQANMQWIGAPRGMCRILPQGSAHDHVVSTF